MLDPNSKVFREIQTPALVLDAEALVRNISVMAAAAKASGIHLRPHAKTHKSSRIAQLQLDSGAVGISCATVAEIEAFSRSGISDLLLTSPVSDRPKLQRLADIFRQSKASIVVDHADQINGLSDLLGEDSHPFQVLVDIDVGQRRTGVCDVQSTLELARLIATKPRLVFGGIQGFGGQVQHLKSTDERKNAASVIGKVLDEHLHALRSEGIAAEIVTGSGTGTCSFDSHGPYTELQVGSYVFMDADYGQLEREGGGALPYEPSLFVLATVTSINRTGEFTIDAGVKALACNGPVPDNIIGAPEGSTYRFGGDEHGMIKMRGGCLAPKLGSRVLVKTTHCDPTVNLYSAYHVFDRSGRIEKWPVMARY